MMVVMAIMLLITTFLLINQSRFDSSTILRSLAYSMALSVRQAQVYGTSVVGTTTVQSTCVGGFYTTGNCYASAYGLHFDSSFVCPDGNTLTCYTLFADLNSDGKFTASPTEFIKNFNFSKGYTITDFCVKGTNLGSPVTRCSPSVINTLDIIFKRPNPDASFTALFNGSPIAGDSYSGAYIQIQSTGDSANTKRISVLSTGEVTVCTTVGC
jgi:hypothetical protein